MNEYVKERLFIFPHTTTLCHSSFLRKDDGNSKLLNCTKIVVRLLGMTSLLARCGQVHLVFHSYLSELGQINYRPIMEKHVNPPVTGD
jgi:hypothetical protein